MSPVGQIERTYTPEEVDKGLTALIVLGSSNKAVIALKERFGLDVPARTLRDWRHTYHDRYFEIARQHGQELEQKAVDTKRALLPLLAEGISLGVEKTIEELESGEAKDPSASARNLAVISGIETRDLLTLTGRPSEYKSSLSPEELYRKLTDVFEGDAEEIPEDEGQLAAGEAPAGVRAIRRDAPSQRAPE